MTLDIDSPVKSAASNAESSTLKLNSSKDIVNIKNPRTDYKTKIIWFQVVYMGLFHVLFFPGLYLAITKSMWQTNIHAMVLYVVGKTGTMVGAHRLWSHRSFKASRPLAALLMAMYSCEGHGSAWLWARDHRVHHKHQDTDADPHSAARGLWFSHMGWVLVTKHPDVIDKRKTIDTGDLDTDSIVQFQKRYYYPLFLLLVLFLPTTIPAFFWGESLTVAFMVAVIVRSVFSFHGSWVLNSLAHYYGSRPYDKNLTATNNKPSTFVTLGEGWHNYHHTFPWDYRSSEMGFQSFNLSKGFIDLFAKIGWASDLKTVSPETIERRARRTGDGSRAAAGGPDVWGWDDSDLTAEERRSATIVCRKHD